MRFRFTGGLEVPEWLYAEVVVISKMSSIRLKLICRQIISQLCGKDVNYEKVNKLTTSDRLNFSRSDIKAMVAAVEYIFRNAAKFDISAEILRKELEQLGLPQDSCAAVCKEYSKKKEEMAAEFAKRSLALPRVASFDWRVDYVVASSDLKESAYPTVRMCFGVKKTLQKSNVNEKPAKVAFEMTANKFLVFHSELKAAQAIMKGL